MFPDGCVIFAVTIIGFLVLIGTVLIVRDWMTPSGALYCQRCGERVDERGAAGLCYRCVGSHDRLGRPSDEPIPRPEWSEINLEKFGGTAGAQKGDLLRPEVRGVQEQGRRHQGETHD